MPQSVWVGVKRIIKNNLAEMLEDWRFVDGEKVIDELCVKVGIARKDLDLWMSNEVQIPVWAAVDIADYAGVNASYILGITDCRCDPDLASEAIKEFECSSKQVRKALTSLETAFWL